MIRGDTSVDLNLEQSESNVYQNIIYCQCRVAAYASDKSRVKIFLLAV